MTRRLASIVALIAMVSAACAGDAQVTGARRNVGVVTVVFTATPAHVRAGQPVRLALRLQNTSGRERDLVFRQTRLYDFWVTRGGREIWRWSQDRVFEPTRRTVVLEPTGARSYAASWTPSEEGTFGVWAEVAAEGFAGDMRGTVEVR